MPNGNLKYLPQKYAKNLAQRLKQFVSNSAAILRAHKGDGGTLFLVVRAIEMVTVAAPPATNFQNGNRKRLLRYAPGWVPIARLLR